MSSRISLGVRASVEADRDVQKARLSDLERAVEEIKTEAAGRGWPEAREGQFS